MEWQARKQVMLSGLLAIATICAAVAYANKASRHASAILRWRDLIQSVARGENVYNEWTKDGSFPYPPVAGLVLWPIAQLPPLTAALLWFCFKLVLAAIAIRWSIQLVTERHERFSLWQIAILLAVASRPLLSDLQHGNINILILFLTTAGLKAFRTGRDCLAGALIALAGAIKVTPLLFIPYFALKRQKTVVGSSLVSLAAFLLLLPGTILGFERNWWLVRSWSGAMVEPYLLEGKAETLQTNQSLPGVLLRLITDCPGIELEGGTQLRVNWISVPPQLAQWIVKLVVFGVILWISWLSHKGTADRRDPALSCEYALVFVAMLLVSERSWKHHFVTMTLPYASLIVHAWPGRCSTRLRDLARTTLAVSFLLMASTSSEVTGWIASGAGHKFAQAYGMFCASGVLALIVLSILHRARTAVVAPVVSLSIAQLAASRTVASS